MRAREREKERERERARKREREREKEREREGKRQRERATARGSEKEREREREREKCAWVETREWGYERGWQRKSNITLQSGKRKRRERGTSCERRFRSCPPYFDRARYSACVFVVCVGASQKSVQGLGFRVQGSGFRV